MNVIFLKFAAVYVKLTFDPSANIRLFLDVFEMFLVS